MKEEKKDEGKEIIVVKEEKMPSKTGLGKGKVREVVKYVPVSDFQKVFENVPVGRARGIMDEFKEFVNEFNFVALAIGFVIGAASKDVVNSLVKDIISPLLGLFLPKGSLEGIVVNVASAELRVGAFINELISFVIIAGIIFVVAVKVMKIKVKKK